MNFPALDNLNAILNLLQGSLVTVMFTLAGVIGVVAIGKILLDHDTSPAARSQRWDKLILVFICIGLLAGLGALIAFARSFGAGL